MSPDEKNLAFAMSPKNGNTDIYLLNLKSNFIKRLTNHPAVDYLPVWDPSGKRIAYTSHSSSTPNVHVIDLVDNSKSQITDVGDAVWTHQWTPTDSTLILKTLGDMDSTSLVMINLDRKITTTPLNLRDRYTIWMTKSPDNPLNPIDYTLLPNILSTKDYSFLRHVKHFTSIILPLPIPFAVTQWTDALGKHELILNGGSFDYGMTYPFFGFNYIKEKH